MKVFKIGSDETDWVASELSEEETLAWYMNETGMEEDELEIEEVIEPELSERKIKCEEEDELFSLLELAEGVTGTWIIASTIY